MMQKGSMQEGSNETIFLSGRDGEHAVYDIKLEDVYIKGQPLTSLADVRRNTYVRDVTLFSGGKQADTLEAYPGPEQCVPLDISPMCNIVAGNDIGLYGIASFEWMTMPGGVTTVEGIPFHITGQGRAPIGDYKRFAVPPDRRRSNRPTRMDIDAKAEWLFFLQTTINAVSEIDAILCRYLITYQDGTAETINVRNLNDAHDWRHWSIAGWQASFGGLRAYIMPWKNSHPKKEIKSIEMLGGDIPELPVLMAITRA